MSILSKCLYRTREQKQYIQLVVDALNQKFHPNGRLTATATGWGPNPFAAYSKAPLLENYLQPELFGTCRTPLPPDAPFSQNPVAGALPAAGRKRERKDIVDQQLENEREGLVAIDALDASFYENRNEDNLQPAAKTSRVRRL